MEIFTKGSSNKIVLKDKGVFHQTVQSIKENGNKAYNKAKAC